jgi:hypothetical protein
MGLCGGKEILIFNGGITIVAGSSTTMVKRELALTGPREACIFSPL